MKRNASWLLISLLTAGTWPAGGVEVPVPPAEPASAYRAQPPPPTPPPPVSLTVDPADEPRPALRYTLVHDVLDQVPGNAAIAYARTTRLLHQNANWKEDSQQVEEWLALPIEDLPLAEVTRLLAGYSHALDELRRATRYERCDWEIPIRTDGINALMPHLSETRSIARLLLLDLRRCLREGRVEDAIDRLRTGLTLASHMGNGPILIEGLVGIAITQMMLDQVVEIVRQPDAPNLYWALTDLPPTSLSLWRATRWERSFLYVHAPLLRHPDQPVTAADLQRALIDLHQLGGGDIPQGWLPKQDQAAFMITAAGWALYPIARQHLAGQGFSPDQLDRLPAPEVLLRYVAGGYAFHRDELFKWFALPYPEAREGLARAEAAFEAAMAANQPDTILPRMLLPALTRAAVRFADTDRQFALLRCIEAIRLHAARHGQLPASLEAIQAVPVPRDPMTGEPFLYRLENHTAFLEPAPLEEVSPRRHKVYAITLRP